MQNPSGSCEIQENLITFVDTQLVLTTEPDVWVEVMQSWTWADTDKDSEADVPNSELLTVFQFKFKRRALVVFLASGSMAHCLGPAPAVSVELSAPC